MPSFASLLLLTLFSLLALLAVPGIRATSHAPNLIHDANKIFWLAALLLACVLPFIIIPDVSALMKSISTLTTIIILFFIFILEQERYAEMENSQKSIREAFVTLTNRMDGEDQNLCSCLHDELNPCLIFAKRKIEECLVLAQGQENIAAVLSRSMLEIDRAYSMSRAIIKKVHVEIVESIGLIAALEDLISHYNEISPLHPKLQHNLSRKIEKSIDRSRSIIIYKIIREALLNAIKHSRARNLSVSVLAQPRQEILRITIIDDGEGMANHAKPGVGLIDMRIRAIQAGGTLSIRNGDDNCGTLIDVTIPLPR